MAQNFISVRELTLNDIPATMDLVLNEGWNQTESDWKFLIECRQNVCLGAEINGVLAGTSTAISYSERISWIGMVLVNRSHRGRGVASVLLQNLLDRLHLFKSIKLDATPAGHNIYKKLGFEDEYHIIRMINYSLKEIPCDFTDIIQMKPITGNDVSYIIKFDQEIFGADRSQLIESLIYRSQGKGKVIKRNNQVSGFILGRQGNKFYQVGPVIATSDNDARLLIQEMLKDLAGYPVVTDILRDKTELKSWLTSTGFKEERQFTRMYLGKNNTNGVTSWYHLISGPEYG